MLSCGEPSGRPQNVLKMTTTWNQLMTTLFTNLAVFIFNEAMSKNIAFVATKQASEVWPEQTSNKVAYLCEKNCTVINVFAILRKI